MLINTDLRKSLIANFFSTYFISSEHNSNVLATTMIKSDPISKILKAQI
jgi:hypothetical protein